VNINDQKMWLLVDSVVKKLRRAKYWTTSVDDYNKDLIQALELLEEVLRKIEKRPLDL
jgi:hypothetical protein